MIGTPCTVKCHRAFIGTSRTVEFHGAFIRASSGTYWKSRMPRGIYRYFFWNILVKSRMPQDIHGYFFRGRMSRDADTYRYLLYSRMSRRFRRWPLLELLTADLSILLLIRPQLRGLCVERAVIVRICDKKATRKKTQDRGREGGHDEKNAIFCLSAQLWPLLFNSTLSSNSTFL